MTFAATYDQPIAFGARAYELLAPLGLGDKHAVAIAAKRLCRATGGYAWPVSWGKGGGKNLTPVSARHVVSLLLAVMGRGGRGCQDVSVADAYERIATLTLPEKGGVLLVLAELFARRALGLDGRAILEDFAEVGAWLSVRMPGDLIKIHTSYDRPGPEAEFVVCTPYGEADQAPPLAMHTYRSLRMADFLALADAVQAEGMTTKPLPMGIAA